MKEVTEDKYWASKALSAFCDNLVEKDLLKVQSVAGVVSYITNDSGARHFYNWFNKIYSANLKLNYKRRNKFVKWFIDYADYSNK